MARLALCIAILAGACVVPVLPYVLPFALPYVLFCLAFHPMIRFPRPRADLSYGVYLYGFPIQQLFVCFLRPAPLALFVLTLPCALLCAAMSWYSVERPALRLGQRNPARLQDGS